MDQPYCLRHETRLMDSSVGRFYFDHALVVWIMQHQIDLFQLPHPPCFMCKIPEEAIRDCLREAAQLEVTNKR